MAAARGCEREQPEPAGAKAVLLCPSTALAGSHSPQHTHAPHTMLKEQLLSLKINRPPCRLTVLIGHCCHLARCISSIRRSSEPVYFLTAAQPEAGINASLVTHCLCRDICKLSQGFPFFPTGDKILYNYRCSGTQTGKWRSDAAVVGVR